MRPTDTQPQPTLAVRQPEGENQGVTTVNTWLNPHTCGWGPRVDDPPFTCDSPLTCSTNANHIMGCASDAPTAFPFTCIGRGDQIISISHSLGKREIAYCDEATAPACATLVFPGHPPGPPALQFRCQATSTEITMLTVPYQVDLLQRFSSLAHAATSTGDGSLSTAITSPTPTAESPLHTAKTSPTTTTKADLAIPIHTDTGAIAGGVVGGIALLLLLPLFWYLFRKNYPKKKKSTTGGQQTDDGPGALVGGREPEYYYPKYKKKPAMARDSARHIPIELPPMTGESSRHIPIELTGYSPRTYGANGSDSGPADVQQQEREGFGLGSMYRDAEGAFQPAGSLTTLAEESAGGSSGKGQSSAMGRAAAGTVADKGKGKAEDGNFNNRAARVSDASSQYSQEGMAWKR